MKHTYLFLLLCPFLTIAQSIKGQLLNKETSQGISYASIGLNDKNIGTVSNIDGYFTLMTPDNDEEQKITISALGYHSKQVSIAVLKKDARIYLEEAPEELATMIIPPKNAKIKKRIYGRTNEGSGTITIATSSENMDVENIKVGYEIGVILHNKGLSQLNNFNLHISKNPTTLSKYRLTLYEVKNGEVSTRIPHQDIIIVIRNGKTGWLKVDLEDYNIYLEKDIRKFAATLTLLERKSTDEDPKKNVYFNTSLAINQLLVLRQNINSNWMKVPLSFPMYFNATSYIY